MLRLRLGMGVGIKADVLSFLLGRVGGHATIQEIAQATHYYGRAVRRAVEELAAAGFVQSRSTAPASFRVDMSKWHYVLDFDPDDPPEYPQTGIRGLSCSTHFKMRSRSTHSI